MAGTSARSPGCLSRAARRLQRPDRSASDRRFVQRPVVQRFVSGYQPQTTNYQTNWTFALSALPSPGMLPAKRTDAAHDQTLQSVVDKLTGGSPQRPDSPEAWITAVRRLPARTAE